MVWRGLRWQFYCLSGLGECELKEIYCMGNFAWYRVLGEQGFGCWLILNDFSLLRQGVVEVGYLFLGFVLYLFEDWVFWIEN